MPTRTRSRSNSTSNGVNGAKESSNADLLKKTANDKPPPRKRSSSSSRRSAERSSGKSRQKSRSRSRSRSQGKGGSPSNRSPPPAKSEKKSEKKESVRQKTPPRPRPPSELVESPPRSSERLRHRQEASACTVRTQKVTVQRTTVVERSSGMGAEDERKKAVPRTKNYSFGGPLGTLAMILGLPLLVHILNFVCLDPTGGRRRLLAPASWFAGLALRDCLDARTNLLLVGWCLFQAAVAVIPFGGSQALGQPLHSTGQRLRYNCNGFFALCLTLGLIGAGVVIDLALLDGRLAWLTFAADHFLQLSAGLTLLAVLLSVLLYVKALRAPDHALAPEGNSGCTPYDFFMGHELNPRLGPLDLKFFCEFRPGLIGWVVLDIALCAQFWQLHGRLSPAMVVVTLFHLLYVADGFYFEESILSTMDILHEGFGFMLAYGDLVWVPCTYTLTVRFLMTAPGPLTGLGYAQLVGAVVLCLVGYWIFRGANSQKDQFRRNPHHPSVAALDSIPTASGRRLLAGGWWGLVRHPNYLGDILMAFAWSLPCGFASALPWFYPVYLTALLVGRELRDEAACLRKHGHGWKKYKELVPYRIFPRVF